MSTTTIYACDACKTPGESGDLWTVRVYASHSMGHGTDYQTPVKKVDLCRPCLMKCGIHDNRPPEEKATAPAPETAEDLVRRLVEMVLPQGE